MNKEKFSCQKCGKCCNKDPVKDRFGLILFDFEKKQIEKIAKEHNVELNIKPHLSITDKNSKKEIVILYNFEADKCPFYKQDCLIYDDRPIVCRAFPVMTAGTHSKGEVIKNTYCPENKRLKPKDDETIKDVIDVFGDCFLYCYLFERLLDEIKKDITKLTNDDIISPSKGDFEKIDVGDFLRQHGLYKDEEELRLLKETIQDTKDFLISNKEPKP